MNGGRQGIIVGTTLALAACSSATTGAPPLTSDEEQGDPRLVAEATSEGLNLCYRLADAGTIEQPDPQWGATLGQLRERARSRAARPRAHRHAGPGPTT